jgi:hypothetical protein
VSSPLAAAAAQPVPVPVHDGQPYQKVLVFDAATGGMDMRLISLQELKEAIVRRVREVPSVG